jgi:hypothetical protein
MSALPLSATSTGNLTGGDRFMTRSAATSAPDQSPLTQWPRVHGRRVDVRDRGRSGKGGDLTRTSSSRSTVATGGSITIGGLVSTAAWAAAGGNLTTGAITANQIEALAACG